MSFIKKLNNWTHSSIPDDKQEIEVYQVFQTEIESINKTIEEFIKEEGIENYLLHILYNGRLVSLSFLETLKSSILNNNKLSIQDRIKESSLLEETYRKGLDELRNRIINMARIKPDNVYLSKISSSLEVINTLLKRYLHLTAIKRSSLMTISNYDELKRLEDNITIRISELNYRITTDTMKR